MAAYLFSWDPNKWDWQNLKEQADAQQMGAPVIRMWACGDARRIFAGDRIFIIRQSKEPRGIFASGEVTRGSYEIANANIQDAQHGRNTLVVDFKFDYLTDANKQVVIPRTDLRGGALSKFIWDIKVSGTKIPDNVAAELEKLWTKKKAKAFVEAGEKTEEEKPAKAEAADKSWTSKKERASKSGGKEKADTDYITTIIEAGKSAKRKLTKEDIQNGIVDNYFSMLKAEVSSEMYSKADFRNHLKKQFGIDDPKLVEIAHRQISAILAEIGLPTIDGYATATKHSKELEAVVYAYIEDNSKLIKSLWIDDDPASVNVPMELDDSKAVWVAEPPSSDHLADAVRRWVPPVPMELDFRVREARNLNLAKAGERFAIAYERARLREIGRKDFLDRISWVSEIQGEDLGYNIHSYEKNGKNRFISVKTTNYGIRFPFYLTRYELAFAQKNPGSFYIYRIFNFSRNTRLFIVEKLAQKKKKMLPVMYRYNI